MLAVLQGSGLGDVAAVVTRYFGGTKLGTGGLVRAFSGALKAALEALPRAERVEHKSFTLVLPYALYDRVKILVAAHHGDITSEDFGADVTLSLRFVVDDVDAFAVAVRDASAGRVRVE
jgi:putative IMPACT (imprinted ancient) family translation regulator